jgi:hypothetical protein
MDGQTYATASIYNPNTHWTPEESERLRIERMEMDRELRNDTLLSYQENRLEVDNRLRRVQEINEHINRIEEQQLRLFQATTTVTVNPTLWTKIKIFGTQVKLFFKECWQYEPIGLIFVTLLTSVVGFIGIMKLLGY